MSSEHIVHAQQAEQAHSFRSCNVQSHCHALVPSRRSAMLPSPLNFRNVVWPGTMRGVRSTCRPSASKVNRHSALQAAQVKAGGGRQRARNNAATTQERGGARPTSHCRARKENSQLSPFSARAGWKWCRKLRETSTRRALTSHPLFAELQLRN